MRKALVIDHHTPLRAGVDGRDMPHLSNNHVPDSLGWRIVAMHGKGCPGVQREHVPGGSINDGGNHPIVVRLFPTGDELCHERGEGL